MTIISILYCIGLKHPESQPLYTETGQHLQKWMTILDFAFLKFTPILAVCPALIVSFVTYYTTDLGGSAFELAAPIW